MSKTAVIELNQSEIDFLEYLLNIGIANAPTAYTLAAFRLKNNIHEQTKENKSAVKWNLPIETPRKIGMVLVRRSLCSKLHVACYVFGRFETLSQEPIPNADIDAWAYLPK